MFKISKNLITLILIAVVVGAGMILWSSRIESEIINLNSVEISSEKQVEEKAVLIIDKGESAPLRFEKKAEEGESAFDILEKSGVEFEYIEEEMGVLIESIDGKQNGEEEKYWMYYINGEMPMKACNKKTIVPGDKIEFKFQESQF